MRQRRQSTIINNFFTLASIIIISVTLTLYVKYIVNEPEITKTKVVPLQCEKETLTKYKVYNQELLNESQKALRRGYFKLKGSFKGDVPKDIISADKLEAFYIQAIQKKPKEDIKKFLSIEYTLLAKDKNDKIERKDFYSGSVLTTFKADKKDIFKIYTDFRFYDEDEILSRIECSIKAYKNNVKKLR